MPIRLQGSRKVVIYGKPEETKEAKEIVEEEVGLVKKVLSSRSHCFSKFSQRKLNISASHLFVYLVSV